MSFYDQLIHFFKMNLFRSHYHKQNNHKHTLKSESFNSKRHLKGKNLNIKRFSTYNKTKSVSVCQ